MCSARVLAVAAGPLLAGSHRPAFADSLVLLPNSAENAISSTANTAAPARDGSPTPAEIAALRDRVDHHAARVRVGQDLHDIRGARFDSVGVAFDSRRLRPRHALAYYEPRSPLPSSLIAWDRVARVEARVPSALRGAIWGMSLLPVAPLAGRALKGDDVTDFGTLGNVAATGAPIGAFVGAGVGAFVHHSKLEWDRFASASPAR